MTSDLSRTAVADDDASREQSRVDEKVRRYHSWKDGKLLPPQEMYIAPTVKCNNQCVYCVHSMPQYRTDNYPHDLDENTILRLVREGIALGVKHFNIVGGGEPFLRKELAFSMMKEIMDAGVEGAITTNAVLLDDEMIVNMVEMGWVSLLVSLDSHDETTADELRGEGTYTHCVRLLKRFAELKKEHNTHLPVIALNVVITSLNYTHVPEMLRFAAEHGIWNVTFIPITTHTAEQEKLKLNPAQAEEFQHIIRNSLHLPGTLGLRKTNLHSLLDSRITEKTGNMIQVLNDESESGKRPEESEMLPRCFDPWSSLVVHPDGHLNPCQHNSKASHIGNRSLEDAWYNDTFLESMRKMHAGHALPEFCQKCCSAVVAERLQEQEVTRKKD